MYLEKFRSASIRSAILTALSCVLVGGGTLPQQVFGKPKAAAWQTNLDAGRKALTGGEYSDAQRYIQAALDETRTFKDGDPRMGITFRTMGDLQVRAQNYTLAKEYYERALAVDQKLLGAEHLDVADELYGIALCNQQLGDFLAAEIFLKRVEEIWRKKLGATNPRLISVLPAMGAYASLKNNFNQAEIYYRQLVSCAEASGTEPARLGNYLNLLATVLGNEGKFSEAKDFAIRSVDLLKKTPENNIALDAARDNLAIVESKAVSSSSADSPVTVVRTKEPERPVETTPAKPTTPVIAKTQESEKKPVTDRTPEPDKTPVKTQEPTKVSDKKPVDAPKIVPDTSPPKTDTPDSMPIKTAVALPHKKPPVSTSEKAPASGRRPWETDRVIKKQDNDKSQSWGKVRYLADGKLISAEEYKALLLASEAYEMIKQEKYRMAADILTKAQDFCPYLPSVQTNLGLVLSRLGRQDEAIDHLQQSIALDSERSAAWVNLASCFQSTGRLSDCVDTYKEYLTRFPSDSLAVKAKDLLAHLEKELAEQNAIAASGKTDANDYFAYTTYDGTVKWPAARQPVKVHIAAGTRVPGFKPEYDGLFQDSFKQWQEASGGKVTFDLAAKPDNCDIECIWTDDQSQVSSPSEGGEAQLRWNSDGIQHVKVIILTKDPTPDSPLSANQIRAVCLHEIGHSIGLVGHSPRPQDIMFCTMPTADAKVALSPRDVGTLKHLYQNDVMIALAPKERGGSGSASDKSSVNNQGVELMESKAYAQAIEKFEAALRLDPTYDVARENLAKACNNYAIDLNNKGNPKEAESLFKKAMDLQGKLKSLATRLSTMENYASFLRRLRRQDEAAKIEQEAKQLKGNQ